MKKEHNELYPMNGKNYFILYHNKVIAVVKVNYDSLNYILAQFLAIKKESIFMGAFSLDQNIRFRRPFEGFNFVFISKGQNPIKSREKKYFLISDTYKKVFNASKKSKKS